MKKLRVQNFIALLLEYSFFRMQGFTVQFKKKKIMMHHIKFFLILK